MKRWWRAVTTSAWLVVVWVMLWGTWTVGTILAGVVVAIGIKLVLPLPRVALDHTWRPAGVLVLVAHFLRDLVVSSVHVAWLALRPGPPLPSAVVRVTLRARSDLVLTVVTELVSLVPGSLVLEVSQAEHALYAHVLDAKTPETVEGFREGVLALEERVVRAIGTDDDLALVEAT